MVVCSENVGLVGLTRVGSRRVVQIAAGFMLFFSIFGMRAIRDPMGHLWTEASWFGILGWADAGVDTLCGLQGNLALLLPRFLSLL